MEKNTNLPDCCRPVLKPENRKGIWWGVLYGLLPHTFCIAFIILSILGATAGAAFIGKFLAMKYFFYILAAMSLVFATVSALFYLGKNGRLSRKGIIASKKYLAILYGTTVGISLIMVYAVLPVVIGATEKHQTLALDGGDMILNLQVGIPCSGHALFIIGELDKIRGVKNVEFISPNEFRVFYDRNLTSPQAIISPDIFKTYKATIK